jgi:hypothetical protein
LKIKSQRIECPSHQWLTIETYIFSTYFSNSATLLKSAYSNYIYIFWGRSINDCSFDVTATKLSNRPLQLTTILKTFMTKCLNRLFGEKTRGRKSRDRVHLTINNCIFARTMFFTENMVLEQCIWKIVFLSLWGSIVISFISKIQKNLKLIQWNLI